MRISTITLFLLAVLSYGPAQEKISKPSVAKFSGRVVVFFGPSQTEYDKLAKDENSGIDEVLSDFQFYASKVKPFLDRQKIRSAITSADIIEIVWSKKNFRFERRKSGHTVGVIMCDGIHEPKVFFDVATDDDLKDEFKSYFTIK